MSTSAPQDCQLEPKGISSSTQRSLFLHVMTAYEIIRTSMRFQDQKEKPASSGGVATARYADILYPKYYLPLTDGDKTLCRKSTLRISSHPLHRLPNPNPPLRYPTPLLPLDNSPHSSRSTAAVLNSPNSISQVNGKPREKRAVQYLN